MAVKPPALLHKMSLTHQRNWYSKNDPGNMPAHLTTSVAKSKSAKVDPVKTKAREKLSLKAYGATKGTKVGEVGGEKPAGDKDTIAPLTRDQHSKVQAAKRSSAPAKAAAPALKPGDKAGRLALIKAVTKKSQSAAGKMQRAAKHDVPTEDPDDRSHDDMMDVHHSLHIGHGHYNEEVEQVNEMDSEGYKGTRDDGDPTKGTGKGTPMTRKAMAKAALKSLQGTPVISINDLNDKDYKRNKLGVLRPTKLKADDPRVKFHKEDAQPTQSTDWASKAAEFLNVYNSADKSVNAKTRADALKAHFRANHLAKINDPTAVAKHVGLPQDNSNDK